MNFKAYKIIQAIGHLHAAIRCLKSLGDENPFPTTLDQLLRMVDKMECNTDEVPDEGRIEY